MSIHKNTQVVFVHKGYKWYLPYVLNQAKYSNPKSSVVVLGDPSCNFNIQGVHVENLDNLESEESRMFLASYRHMSPNNEKYELFCFLRWFYLLEYMRRSRLSSIFHLDSDVLLYSSIDTIRESYADLVTDCAYLIPEQSNKPNFLSAYAHISYWAIEVLEEFCNFIINSFCDIDILNRYERKWKLYQANESIDGVSDMTALYFFWEQHRELICNLAIDHSGNVFDVNLIGSGNYYDSEYAFGGRKKIIKFVDGQPFFCKTLQKNELTRVHALHCQGRTKNFIPSLYTGNHFPGKLKGDLHGVVKVVKFYLKT
jgi:hypothetical protein